MDIEFPVDVYAFAAPFGVAVFVAIVLQWLKHYLPDWRWTNLVGLGLGEIAAVVASTIIFGGKPGPDVIFAAIMIGLFGSSLATFGYEGITNILGMLNVGGRSDRALKKRALEAAREHMVRSGAPRG